MNQCSTTPSANNVDTSVRLAISNGVDGDLGNALDHDGETAAASVTEIGKNAPTGLRAK